MGTLFQIVAHLRRGPMSWGTYDSRDAVDRKLYALWAEKIPGIGRLTPWEIAQSPRHPGTFTVWKQDPEAGRQWRVVRSQCTHAQAKQIAQDSRRAVPFWPRSPERALILPDGAPPPPREPSFAVEIKARALGHDGWERVEAGMSARDADSRVKALRRCLAHARQDARAAGAIAGYLRLKSKPLGGGWEEAEMEVRARALEPFSIVPGRRYRIVRTDVSRRWEHGAIGVAIPNDFDKYDAKLVLGRLPLPPLPDDAGFVERMDHWAPVFYFYTDEIEPVPGLPRAG